MAKINFTAARIERHRCEPGKSQSFLWDSNSPGLGVRATANGAKTYIFQGKIHGQTLRVTIGDPRSWSIDKAQEEARRLQTLIDSGIDPRVQKAAVRAASEAAAADAKRVQVTFGEAWEVYAAARKPKWSDRHYNDHINMASVGGVQRKRGEGNTVGGPLADLRTLKLSELTSDRIAAWLDSQTEHRPTMAALAYRLLRAFIRWAADSDLYRGTVPDGSYKSSNVKDALPRVRAKEGDCLQREQLPAWFGAVLQIGNPIIRTYLQALLITGARREEMAALRWDDVDCKWRSLSISDKVEESGRVIPLPPYLLSLLAELKRISETPPNVRMLARMSEAGEEWKPSPWVFASRASSTGYIAEPRIAHTNALLGAGLPHISLHGLRRSFGTLAEWCEVPVGVVAQIQGHKPSAIAEKHYRRRPIDLLRMWHDKIESWMLEQSGVTLEVSQESPNLKMVSNS